MPPGFTITTEVCTAFYANDRTYPAELEPQVAPALAAIEQAVGLGFGDAQQAAAGLGPLRRARLDARHDGHRAQSRPQRRDGGGPGRRSRRRRFAWDSYRRFIQMYGIVVLGVDHHRFEEIIEHVKIEAGVTEDTALTAEDWQRVVDGYKEMVEQETGKPFPQDPQEQLWGAIGAVFGSWMNPRAITYRRLHDIPGDWGTAVNVQAMVFGNMGEDCATGVCFTRDPSTGENVFYGEFLVNAQGEDVVAGIRTPQPLVAAPRAKAGRGADGRGDARSLRRAACACARQLEQHYRDMQDIEFTVQQNKLYMLQTRNGKRTAAASLRDRGRDGGRGADRPGRGGAARQSRLARPTAASDAGPEGRSAR